MASNYSEMESFISKFKFLTSIGCKASLNFMSSNEQVSVTLSTDLGYYVSPYTYQSTSSLPRRRHRGPAYFRRQLRRHNAAKASSSNVNSTEVEDEVEPASNPDVLLPVIAAELSSSKSEDNILCCNEESIQLLPSVSTISQPILTEMPPLHEEKLDHFNSSPHSASPTSSLDTSSSEKEPTALWPTVNDCAKFLDFGFPVEIMKTIDEYLCVDPSPNSHTLANIAQGLNIPADRLQQYVESKQSQEMTLSLS